MRPENFHTGSNFLSRIRYSISSAFNFAMKMRRKVRVSINLPPELVKKAKGLGLNISKIAENALREFIRRLEGSDLVRGVGFQQEFTGKY